MKNKPELTELNKRELLQLSGGVVWYSALALAVLGSAIYDVASNHETFADGFSQGYKSSSSKDYSL